MVSTKKELTTIDEFIIAEISNLLTKHHKSLWKFQFIQSTCIASFSKYDRQMGSTVHVECKCTCTLKCNTSF